MPGRRHDRMPYAVEVSFRTASSFLVAYSVNLSKGGIFLETAHRVPRGSMITLRFTVPGVGPLEVDGRVSWCREVDPADGAPVGLGIEFDRIDDACGAVIDELVAGFTGLTILVASADEADRLALVRLVRTLLATAAVLEAPDAESARLMLDEHIDLVIIDHDTIGLDELIGPALGPARPAVPILALAAEPDDRSRARALGADEVAGNPPPFPELQRLLLSALGRPLSVR